MSRPYWSAPSQWSAPGAESALERSWSKGSYGTIQGASTHTSRKTTMIASPATADGRAQNRLAASVRGLAGSRTAAAGAGRMAALMPPSGAG